MKIKIKIFLKLVCIIMPCNSFSQNIDSSKYIATYNFSFVTDSTDRSKVYKEDMLLNIGEKSSWFVSSILIEKKKLIDAGVSKGKPLGFSLTDPAISKLHTTAPQFYKYPQQGILKEVRTFFRDFIWNDTVAFKWNIKNDTSIINGYHCLSANTLFKGRYYTAWFCPDIPIADGPWKFYGLPGLIVKITDRKNEVVFEMKNFEKTNGMTSIAFAPESRVIKTTASEFKKLVAASYENPIGVISSITGHTYETSGSPVRPRKPPVSKNAIELQE